MIEKSKASLEISAKDAFCLYFIFYEALIK